MSVPTIKLQSCPSNRIWKRNRKNRNIFNCLLLLYWKWEHSLAAAIWQWVVRIYFVYGIFFQPIHTDYAYFENKHHINTVCSENWAERIHGSFTFNSIFDIPFLHPRWLPLLLAEISNGLKKESSEIVLSFRSKIENQASDYMQLDVSSCPFHGSAIFDKCLSLWVTFESIQKMNIHLWKKS